MLTTFLSDIKDFRRLQGQRYTLDHMLLLSFLAICCNANTYRQIGLFIHTHFDKLTFYFNLNWKASPHHTTIRNHKRCLSKRIGS
ncbi:MAG: transposase family protein [Segetibacter sp.]